MQCCQCQKKGKNNFGIAIKQIWVTTFFRLSNTDISLIVDVQAFVGKINNWAKNLLKNAFFLSIPLPFTDIFKMIFWKPFPVANVLKGKYVGFFNNLHLKSIWMRFISSPRSYTSLRDKELVRPMKKKKHCQYSKVSWHQVCMKSLFERHLNSVANYF